jgi:hypothetical protein
MAEYSRIAKGHVTTLPVSGGTAPINLPFQPHSVKWWNFTASTSGGSTGFVTSGYWDISMGQGAAIYNSVTASTLALTANTTTTGGITTYAGGLSLQYGPTVQIVSISKANPASVVATGHGLVSGDVVILTGLYQSSTTGMQQIAGMPFTVTVSDANTFTIPWDTTGSNYTALSGSPTGALLKKVLYPYLYFPGTSVISAITAPNGTSIPTGTVQVNTTTAHNFVVGQEVAFRIPPVWGSYQLNSLPDVLIPGSPIYGYVVSVTNYNTVIVKIAASSSFNAFVPNQVFASFSGEFFPQIVAVGDVNTGGVQISVGSPLYPSPYSVKIGDGNALTNGIYTNRSSTINGPAIQGAYVNNTSQGFIIGTTAAPTAAQVIYYEAMLHDLIIN